MVAAGTPEIDQGLIKRCLYDDAGRDLAREELIGEKARLLVGRAEKPLLRNARLVDWTFGAACGGMAGMSRSGRLIKQR